VDIAGIFFRLIGGNATASCLPAPMEKAAKVMPSSFPSHGSPGCGNQAEVNQRYAQTVWAGYGPVRYPGRVRRWGIYCSEEIIIAQRNRSWQSFRTPALICLPVKLRSFAQKKSPCSACREIIRPAGMQLFPRKVLVCFYLFDLQRMPGGMPGDIKE